jgi:predicted PolB exonuclease-like 3'-5' exonuclease
MIKYVANRVWAFDAEWIPDPLAGRLLYDIPESVTDLGEIMQIMWQRGGATDADPTPFLKLAVCSVVSIAALERRVTDDSVTLHLMRLPHDPTDPEQTPESGIVGTFLDAIGERRPQLVGFNSIDSDLKLLVQRGTILGLRSAAFCERPNKPWEGIDYFARGSEYNVDLKEILGGFGKATPSLHEIATQSGIPGKMDVDGNQVAQLWLKGELKKIVEYNEFDALTTYLLWLRLAHFAGHFTGEEYAAEQNRLREYLTAESQQGGKPHLEVYLEEWKRLQSIIGERD